MAARWHRVVMAVAVAHEAASLSSVVPAMVPNAARPLARTVPDGYPFVAVHEESDQ